MNHPYQVPDLTPVDETVIHRLCTVCDRWDDQHAEQHTNITVWWCSNDNCQTEHREDR